MGYRNPSQSRWHPKPCYTCKKWRLKTIAMHPLTDDEWECEMCYGKRIEQQKLTSTKICSNCGHGDKTRRGVEPYDIITIPMDEINDGVYVCKPCIRGWELDTWWKKVRPKPTSNPNQSLINSTRWKPAAPQKPSTMALSPQDAEIQRRAAMVHQESIAKLSPEERQKMMDVDNESYESKPKAKKRSKKDRIRVKDYIFH